MGLKIGIYSDAGELTCQRTQPGSLGFEEIDAKTWVDWGIDYLKYDNCWVPGDWQDSCGFCREPNSTCGGGGWLCGDDYDWSKSKSAERYIRMRDALKKQSRPILYSLCNGGWADVQSWGPSVGMAWRATDDIGDNWGSVVDIISRNAFNVYNVDFYSHSDADMLEIGNGGLNNEQERTHFALWVAMKSPLLIGCDLTKITNSSLEILKSTYLLQFHQDTKFGKAAVPFNFDWEFNTNNPPQHWAGQYSEGTMVWFFNKDSKKATLSVPVSQIPGLQKAKNYLALDGWTGQKYGCISANQAVGYKDILPHDTKVFILKPDACSDNKIDRVGLQAPMQA
jgi:alpha-galactosidase